MFRIINIIIIMCCSLSSLISSDSKGAIKEKYNPQWCSNEFVNTSRIVINYKDQSISWFISLMRNTFIIKGWETCPMALEKQVKILWLQNDASLSIFIFQKV